MSLYPYQRNLGYFATFMRNYGQADQARRLELYRDTQAYSGGAEPASTLYEQVYELLGVPLPSPQLGQ